MLRMTSKRVKELVHKVRPPADVRWRMSFFDDRLNGTATKKQPLVFMQLTAGCDAKRASDDGVTIDAKQPPEYLFTPHMTSN
jgi:hypothetical protein